VKEEKFTKDAYGPMFQDFSERNFTKASL